MRTHWVVLDLCNARRLAYTSSGVEVARLRRRDETDYHRPAVQVSVEFEVEVIVVREAVGLEGWSYLALLLPAMAEMW